MLAKLESVLDQVAAQIDAIPVSDPADPSTKSPLTMDELIVSMRLESQLADEVLDAAEAGSRLTKILDARMFEQAKDGPAWRYETPLERRGDEAWDLYRSFRGQ